MREIILDPEKPVGDPLKQEVIAPSLLHKHSLSTFAVSSSLNVCEEAKKGTINWTEKENGSGTQSTPKMKL